MQVNLQEEFCSEFSNQGRVRITQHFPLATQGGHVSAKSPTLFQLTKTVPPGTSHHRVNLYIVQDNDITSSHLFLGHLGSYQEKLGTVGCVRRIHQRIFGTYKMIVDSVAYITAKFMADTTA